MMPIKLLKDRECTVETPVSALGEPQKPVYGTGKRIRPHIEGRCSTPHDKKTYLPELLPLEAYDMIIVLLSGGKDSTAAFWYLIELGVPIEKIEIWHHSVDGLHPYRRMDWPVTQAYVRSFAEAVGAPLRLSWRVNGFFGELYRIGASYPIEYENNREIVSCRLSSKQIKSEEIREDILQGILSEDDLKVLGHRMRFPAKSGDLARRWCSSALKIDVASAVIRRINRGPQQINAIEGYHQVLQQLGYVGKFPAKGSIGTGRWCSPQLKRIVADSVIRSLVGQVNELDALGGNCRFPAKGTSQDGRWCSGKLKASIQNGVTADFNITKDNINILVVSGERRGDFLTSCTRYEFSLLKLV